ncbi:MAG: polysaccharide pyruvyl transferase family protein [Candidatus Brocadiaceae bacterium]
MKNKRKGFLLWGYYGFGNLGDDLMLKVITKKILNKYPDSKILARCYDEPEEKNVIPFPIEKNETSCRVLKTLVYFMRLFKAISRTDYFVLGGGAYFLDKGRHSLSLLFLAIAVLFARVMRKKVYIIGIGMDILTFPLNLVYLKYILRKSTCACLRDNYSFTTASYLVKKDNIYRTSDILFDESFVASLTQDIVSRNKYIIVSLTDYYHTHPSSEKRQLMMNKSSDLIRMLINKYSDKYRILLCAFQKTYGERDYEFLTEIQNALFEDHKDYADKIDLNYIRTEDQIREFFSSAVCVIGMRYHSLVLASLFKKPFIGIDIEMKIREFCGEFTMPFIGIHEFCEKGISSTEIEGLLRNNVSDQTIQDHIKKSRENFEWLNEL